MWGVLLELAGLTLGLIVTSDGPVATGELGVDQALAGRHEAVLLWLAQALGLLFGPVVAPALLLLGCLVIYRRDRHTAIVLGAVTVLGWLSVGATKLLVARPRPVASQVAAVVTETGHDSYPSGHVAFAVALTLATVLVLRMNGRTSGWAWIVGVATTVVLAASRLYIGAHYFADVVGAVVLVTGAVLLMAATRWWADRHGRTALPVL
ncbi:hypothetical protein KILIM_029_00180 [Kineosphaera limosa NBRC 100340]|uniref:Phosphatidic acid phosphatase type 2/haloperoxidase domain-containing protein n=2 Tax=Kineosphaera TaxID=211469 RepID=K6VI64_9MICO|nr:hypothetical protein KILIM_029_00180 [Kineosphaera limosa NBRC 100340]